MSEQLIALFVHTRAKRGLDGVVYGLSTLAVAGVGLFSLFDRDARNGVWVGLACLVVAATLVVMTKRVLWSRIEVTETRVAVHGVVRSRRIARKDVVAIVEGRLRAQPCLYLVVTTGSRCLVPLSLLGGGREQLSLLRRQLEECTVGSSVSTGA